MNCELPKILTNSFIKIGEAIINIIVKDIIQIIMLLKIVDTIKFLSLMFFEKEKFLINGTNKLKLNIIEVGARKLKRNVYSPNSSFGIIPRYIGNSK